jgi:hypothetical protein
LEGDLFANPFNLFVSEKATFSEIVVWWLSDFEEHQAAKGIPVSYDKAPRFVACSTSMREINSRFLVSSSFSIVEVSQC